MQDFGASWRNLTESSKGRIASFVDFGWGAFLKPWSEWREQAADETIFATAYEDPKHMKVLMPSIKDAKPYQNQDQQCIKAYFQKCGLHAVLAVRWKECAVASAQMVEVLWGTWGSLLARGRGGQIRLNQGMEAGARSPNRAKQERVL